MNRLPAIYPVREYVDEGGLLSYGANVADISRRAAHHVDRILKGAKPADLPVEQATTIELVVNRRTPPRLDSRSHPRFCSEQTRWSSKAMKEDGVPREMRRTMVYSRRPAAAADTER
jgi:hypothetical protein